jgi:hypothetical protein
VKRVGWLGWLLTWVRLSRTDGRPEGFPLPLPLSLAFPLPLLSEPLGGVAEAMIVAEIRELTGWCFSFFFGYRRVRLRNYRRSSGKLTALGFSGCCWKVRFHRSKQELKVPVIGAQLVLTSGTCPSANRNIRCLQRGYSALGWLLGPKGPPYRIRIHLLGTTTAVRWWVSPRVCIMWVLQQSDN